MTPAEDALRRGVADWGLWPDSTYRWGVRAFFHVLARVPVPNDETTPFVESDGP